MDRRWGRGVGRDRTSGGNSSVETLQVTHGIGSNASYPVGDFAYYLGLSLRETWIVDCSCYM